jgi:hydrogenase/urease accessory protein HupE
VGATRDRPGNKILWTGPEAQSIFAGVSILIRILSSSMLGLLLLAASLSAHEVRPAYLELTQTGAETWEVLWKVPARGEDQRLALHVELPPGSVNLTPPLGAAANNAFTARWTVRHEGGMAGEIVRIAGLTATLTDVLVRVQRLDGGTQVARLTPATPSFVVEAAPRNLQVAGTYLRLGIEHILLGVDHLLFVLALLILVEGTRRLVMTITAFTLAHSLTLAGATLGFVHVPGPPLEAAIALSIMFVAAEIIQDRQGTAGLTRRAPWIVAFIFGLLHGLGFAGALSEVGLPQSAIPIALLCFNVGVELGQLLFIGLVLGATATAGWIARRAGVGFPGWAWRVPPYAIGTVAAFWLVQRVLQF